MLPPISKQSRKRKDPKRNEDEEVEVLLETPEDVKQLITIGKSQKPHRIRLAQKLFGPPQWTLRWNQRRALFQQLGNMENLTTLIVDGTIMGQVIPGHSLALSISAPSLRVLKVEGGIILDSITYVVDMAEAVRNHKRLEEFSFLNFLNHIIPVDSLYLLDPLLGALCTIPNLVTLRLRCFSSFMHWDTSFASSGALCRLLHSVTHLEHLELTNLGLEDDQMHSIASNTQPDLQELILNANSNTKNGLNTVLERIQPHWTKLEVANDVKFQEDSFHILYDRIQSYTNQLQHFSCTFPLGMKDSKRSIDLQLELHRMNLGTRYYSPLVTPEQRIQLLSEVTSTANSNELDFVYALVREEPMICDLEMNGLGVGSCSKDTRMLQVTLVLFLWLMWSQCLLAGRPTINITEVILPRQTEPCSVTNASSSANVPLDIVEPATSKSGMSRLELARSKRNALRSRVQMKIDALIRTATSKRRMDDKTCGNPRGLKLRRFEIESQRDSLQNAFTSFCNGSARICLHESES